MFVAYTAIGSPSAEVALVRRRVGPRHLDAGQTGIVVGAVVGKEPTYQFRPDGSSFEFTVHPDQIELV